MLRMRTLLLTLAFVLASAGARAANDLQVYFVDVEGGQSTLFVAPSGQSMLVDTGEVAFDGRDPGRIAAVLPACLKGQPLTAPLRRIGAGKAVPVHILRPINIPQINDDRAGHSAPEPLQIERSKLFPFGRDY